MTDKEPEITEIVKKPTQSEIMKFDENLRELSKILTKELKPIFEEKFEVEKVAPKENLFQKYDSMKNEVPKDFELIFTFLDYIREKKPDSFLQILQLVNYFEQKKILGGMLRNNRNNRDNRNNDDVDFELDFADREVVPRNDPQNDDVFFYYALSGMLCLMILGLITVLIGIGIAGNTVEQLGIDTDLWQIIKMLAYPDPGTIAGLLKNVAVAIQEDAVHAVQLVCTPAGYDGMVGLLIGFVFGNRDCGNIGLDLAAQNIRLAGQRLDHGLNIAGSMAYRGFYLMCYGATGTLMLVDSQYNGLATRYLTNTTHFIFGRNVGGGLLRYMGFTREAQRRAIERGGKRKSKRRGRKSKKTRKGRKGKKGRKSRRKH